MNTNTLKKLIKEEIRSILKEGEGEQQHYMFFQNLKTIHTAISELLQMDPYQIDRMISNGHDWAEDHITTAADDIEEVYHFFKSSLMTESNSRNDIANYIIILSNRLIVAKQEGDQKMIDTLTKWIADLKNELNSLKKIN